MARSRSLCAFAILLAGLAACAESPLAEAGAPPGLRIVSPDRLPDLRSGEVVVEPGSASLAAAEVGTAAAIYYPADRDSAGPGQIVCVTSPCPSYIARASAVAGPSSFPGLKLVTLTAQSQSWADVDYLNVLGSFKIAGGSGPDGCNVVPTEFGRDFAEAPTSTSSLSAAVAPGGLFASVNRPVQYPVEDRIVSQVDGRHEFRVRTAGSVDSKLASTTSVVVLLTSARLCY